MGIKTAKETGKGPGRGEKWETKNKKREKSFHDTT